MPTIMLKDDNNAVLIDGTTVQADQTCCCCQNANQCDLTVTLTDINCCEDDIFDIYVGEEYFGNLNQISSPAGCCGGCSSCPATSNSVNGTIYPGVDINPDCSIDVELDPTGYNCCSTFQQVKVSGPGGDDTFDDGGGGSYSTDYDTVCNPAP